MRNSTEALAKDLRKQLSGNVFLRNDPGYVDALLTYNGAVRHRPMLVVRPANSNDLSRILTYAAKHEIEFTIRGGGHSSNGYGLNSRGIVIDNRGLSEIVTSDQDVVVGAGATWSQLYQYLAVEDASTFVIGATWPSVGIAGFLMGGGYSFLSRKMGMACDNMLSCNFVTAEGYEVAASAESTDANAQELFWGLKGGGGGNFGVAAEFKIKKYHAPEPMLTGVITFPFERIDEIIDFYDAWAASLPETLSVYGSISYQENFTISVHSGLVIRLTLAFTGDFTEGLALISPLMRMGPSEIKYYFMTPSEWASYLGGGDAGGQYGAYTRSAMLSEGNLRAVVPIIRAYLQNIPEQAVFVVWTHGGGAIAGVSESEASFPHRQADFILAVRVFWPIERPELMRPFITWGYKFFEALKPFSSGAYVNYIDPLLKNWQAAYYRGSYEKLLNLKEKLDPKNKMLFQQGIGSDFEPEGLTDDQLDLQPVFRTYHT